jgi:hypothetical protein
MGTRPRALERAPRHCRGRRARADVVPPRAFPDTVVVIRSRINKIASAREPEGAGKLNEISSDTASVRDERGAEGAYWPQATNASLKTR